MTDQHKLLRLYIDDSGVRVMAALTLVGLLLAVQQPALSTLAAFGAGWALYLVEEHLIHRFIFHMPAPKSQRLFDLVYRLHYGHHDQDRNRHLLFTPLWFSLPASAVTIAAVWLLIPLTQALILVLAGSGSAYLFFEWMHLISHARVTKGRLGRHVTRRHAKHHYIDYSQWFNLSPGGEVVDAALGADRAVPDTVSHVRTCGLDPDDPRLVRSRARFGLDASLANIAAIKTAVTREQAA